LADRILLTRKHEILEPFLFNSFLYDFTFFGLHTECNLAIPTRIGFCSLIFGDYSDVLRIKNFFQRLFNLICKSLSIDEPINSWMVTILKRGLHRLCDLILTNNCLIKLFHFLSFLPFVKSELGRFKFILDDLSLSIDSW
jgi:hypothetical protein